MNEFTDFEREIARCLDFEPSARVDSRIAAEIRRQAWRARLKRAFRMPARIPLAASLAVLLGAGSLLLYRSQSRAADAEYADALLEIQDLADDDFLDSSYCYL